MAASKVNDPKQKVVYTQDGVFVHTSVPSYIANIIPGRVALIEMDNNTYVDWSPCEFDADNYELQTSDCAEWDLITQNKKTDKEQDKRKQEKSKYAINFNINELHSIRRSDPKLAWSYVVFILKDSTTLPALHFHSGGIQNLIQNLQRYVWLTRSPTNYKLFVVADQENEALRMSLDQLQLFTERGPSSSYLSRFINTAYYDGMDALSKVTKYFRDTMDVIQATPTTTTDTTTHCDKPTEHVRYTPKKDAEFEDLGEAVALPNKPIPHRRCLGEILQVERGPCLTQDVWTSLLDKNGRVINIKKLHNIVFRGGIDKTLRKEVWKYLLGYFKYGCTLQSRHTLFRAKEDEYRTMKMQWSTISAKQEKHFSEFRDRKHLVDKDVTRTDRTHPYFVDQEPENPNVKKLYNVLMTYCMYNFDLGYVQGMSDLLSPVLFTMDSEVDAFWCFVGMMKKLAHNFDENQEGMKMQLHQLTVLLKFIDPLFYSYLEEHDSGNLYFCFRWLIINFKREFIFDDIMILWEALWTQNLSPNFHLFICLAILDKHRQVIMEMGFGFNEILKYINDLAYQIDVNETLITAETLCLQLLALSDVPEEVRAIVTGKNVAVMTPDIERPDPFLMLMTGRNVSGLYPVVEEQSVSVNPGPSSTSNGMNTSLINDLSMVKVNEDGTCNDTSPKPHDNNVPVNVEQQSDDEIVVLSEGAENIF